MSRLDELEAENAELRQAVLDLSSVASSAFHASQRDATHDVDGTTNYRLLANKLGLCLDKYSELVKRLRAQTDGAII